MHPFFIFFFKAFFSYYSNIRIWVGQEPNKTKPASLIPSNFFLCFQLICRYRSSKNILKNWHKSREVLGVKGRNDDRKIEDLVKERGCPFIHLSYKTLKIIFVVWFIKYHSFLQQDSMTNKFFIHMTTRREWGVKVWRLELPKKRGTPKRWVGYEFKGGWKTELPMKTCYSLKWSPWFTAPITVKISTGVHLVTKIQTWGSRGCNHNW